MELYEKVLADQLDEPNPVSSLTEACLEMSEFLLPALLNRLIQLQETLSDLQIQVGQSIQVVEQAIASNALLAQRQPVS